ncbi:uncharacterized protein LAESUDRAFT_737585 [Laetiporus sulphureus 93-53]|uniref:Uncharacterized protein n=1 Tax=Laetiporus sulphureus 93-53 TaxID=1314785 RepID=A0A165DMU5_9APHY|nr:uncharacterized protein LAESUDRAFT_737585 [Laetiporus sulphureus 93-53]KZT05225.1 hypothetical protein LAESUDRAFT_737585 [Laetiporus sulphureus 93-53]
MSSSTPTVVLLGTCDTKLEELLYVHDKLVKDHGVNCKLIDVGRDACSHPAIAITQDELFKNSGLPPPKDLHALPRGELISTIIKHTKPVVSSLYRSQSIHAALCLGGSGGSSLGAEVMRAALPIGFPKLIVSTMAAGDVRPYVGESDIAMMHSVVDIAGLNDILCAVLENAAGAIAGMARVQLARNNRSAPSSPHNKRIAITMFGVTTPAVTYARALLSAYPCTTYVFHATGAGGRALERLASEHFWAGILDLTITELVDALVGGILSAGNARLTAAAAARIPQVISLGALDMANFGPRATVPAQYDERNLFQHNPSITLMRTSREECAILGRQIAERLRDADPSRTEVWVPRAGVSALSVRGQPFWDPDADEALFSAVRDGLKGSGIRVVEEDRDINDPAFVAGMVRRLVDMMEMEPIPGKKAEIL